jgi:antirestriction protein ArdC
MSTKAHRSRNAAQRRDHYAEVTERVITALEAGIPPWQQPWDPDKADTPTMPRNAVTGARYRGINILTLGMSALAFGGGDPRWATYKQAAERGWQVRKGERGTTAFFFKPLELRDTKARPDDEETTKRIPLLRAFTLFHASQIDGMPVFVPSTVEAPWRAPDAVETIIANSGIVVRIGGNRAFYSPDSDSIQMPRRDSFDSADGWSSTILHEAAHASGAPHRLNRDLRNAFGSPDYSKEELRAEIAQMMLCAELGIAECEFTNGAAYIASWVANLKSDRKEIFRAAADAQRIADYLLAFHPDYISQSGKALATADEDSPAEPGPTLAEAA